MEISPSESGRHTAQLPRCRCRTRARIDLRTAVDRHIVPDRNVVAMLEGGDPKLKDEWVIVSAHCYHDGVNGTQILNGADDNGSSTVTLKKIAEAYAIAAQAGQRPKRSLNGFLRGLRGFVDFVSRQRCKRSCAFQIPDS